MGWYIQYKNNKTENEMEALMEQKELNKTLRDVVKKALETQGGVQIENSIPDEKIDFVTQQVRHYLANKFQGRFEHEAVRDLWTEIKKVA